MGEWKEYKLGEICDVINGRAYKQEELLNEGKYRVLRVGNIFQGNNWYYSDLELPEDKYCNKGDLLYAWSCGFAPYIWEGEKTIYHYHIWKLVEKQSLVNKSFLYYYLIENTKRFLGGTHGSVMLHLTKKEMEEQFIKLPPLQTQQKIASILSSLDDKIEVNRKINENLEQQAQALFKSWFVDFEPFKNGEFVESELGMIPKGWRVGNIFDVAEIYDRIRKPLSGKDRENMERLYPYYGATSCMDYVDDFLFDGIYTLIGEDGSVVKEDGLPYMQYVWGKFWVNNHAHILQGKNGFSTEMIHVFLSISNIQHLVTGAVQAKLSQANMQKILLAIPPMVVINQIRPTIDGLYKVKREKEEENSRLASLRDTLLPKLMSGELKVNEL